MKRYLVLFLVFCMMIASVPVAFADGGDEGPSIISNYEQLIAWKEAGCSDTLYGGIYPYGDFGWPTEDVVIDFASSTAVSIPIRSVSWSIPENVTIKNLSFTLYDKATLSIYGKIINSKYVTDAIKINNITAYESTVNLATNAEVYGEIRIANKSKLMSNGAYVESICAANYTGTSGTENHTASIYGTINASQITMHKMDLYLMDGCDLTIEAVRPISGTNETTLYINSGAELTLLEKNGAISIASNVKVMSGGKMNTLANFPAPEFTLTIEAGGEVNAYEGFRIDKYHPDSAIKGKGTINLYGWGFPFRYDNTDYDYNPGNIPEVDSAIVIKSMDECDHAGGKAIMCLPDYTDREQKTHVIRCYCCWEEVEGTKEPHKYIMTEDYEWGTRYECACGRYDYVYKSSGDCGEDVDFNLAYNKLSITGSGETSEFTQEDAPWKSDAETIKEIEIGESVTGIGANAFYGCTSLETVTISSDVTTINASAFASCNSLEKVEYDGTYEQWKEMDVKEGNDAFLYAEIVFNDDSKLLTPADKFCGKTDVLLKTSEGQEATDFELSIIPDEMKVTEEELDKIMVYIAVYNDGGKMQRLVLVPKTEAEGRINFSGDMLPENTFKMMIWADTCTPMARSVADN